MLTRVAPGRYKMVAKNKAGKTGDYEMNFTEHGIYETASVGGLTATCFYRCLQILLFLSNMNDGHTGGLVTLRAPGKFAQRLALKATWTPAECPSP